MDRVFPADGVCRQNDAVSPRLRGSTAAPGQQAAATVAVASPPATRQRRARWRDPKLWLGAVLVLASVVGGAKVLSSADDSVAVWQVARDVPAGSPVARADLRVTRVHFDEPAAADSYVRANEPVAQGAVASHDLIAGEMLTAAAVTASDTAPVRQVPLGVSSVHQPPDLRIGDRVQVWAVPAAAGGQGAGSPALVMRNVAVLSVGGSQAGVSGVRQVLVAVGDDVDIARVLRLTTAAQVVLVRLAS